MQQAQEHDVDDYEWSDHEGNYRQTRKDGTLEGIDWEDLIFGSPPQRTLRPTSELSILEHEHRRDGALSTGSGDHTRLLPIHKPLDGGYWGYNNLSFFAPRTPFLQPTNSPNFPMRHDEFKWTVDQLHQRHW